MEVQAIMKDTSWNVCKIDLSQKVRKNWIQEGGSDWMFIKTT